MLDKAINDEISKRASVIFSEDAYNLSHQAHVNFLETIQNSEIYKLIKNDDAILGTFMLSSASHLLDKILRGIAAKDGYLDLAMLDTCLKEIRGGVIEHFNSEKEKS